jgi:hypothetical protein
MTHTTLPTVALRSTSVDRPQRLRRLVGTVLHSYSAIITEDTGPIPNGSFARAARSIPSQREG